MRHEDIRRRGFKERTPLARARSKFLEHLTALDRTESIPVGEADGRVTAAAIEATRNVPGYDRAAMDGWAVRATDTHGSSARGPTTLQPADAVGEGTAVRVHTGSALPDGATAVVMIEDATEHETGLEVTRSVAVGENVGEAGEDVAAGTTLYEPGTRLAPSDIGLLRSVGLTNVQVSERPRVAVVPTGEELVREDPKPGEIIETNGLTVSRLVDRWGGIATYQDIVPDDRAVLRDALESARDHDLIVTTGGSSVGERDLLPEVLAEIGEILVHGVALKPGHPVGMGHMEDTPVLLLPGYPVACIVNAMQFLRPAINQLQGTTPPAVPTVTATLDRKIRSEPGTRSFVRVQLDQSGDTVTATPVRASGAGVLSSITRADGWVQVPEPQEGFPRGTTVSVERWEWHR